MTVLGLKLIEVIVATIVYNNFVRLLRIKPGPRTEEDFPILWLILFYG